MTQQELDAIGGLFAGMQLCIVHLSNVIADRTELSREVLATSFEETAANAPEGTKNRELIQMAARQVAAGIRDSSAGPDWSELMSRLKP
jgi:hypothetical protein